MEKQEKMSSSLTFSESPDDYVHSITKEAATLIQTLKDGPGGKLNKRYPGNSLQKHLANLCNPNQNLYLLHRISAQDIVRVFLSGQSDLPRASGGPPTSTDLICRILDGRDREAPIRVGLWYTSPNDEFALLQHYHPKGIQNQGRFMKNCMEGETSEFDGKHLQNMLANTRTYTEYGAKRPPSSMLLTINKTDPTLTSPERYLNSEPIVMIEYHPATHFINQIRGFKNKKLDDGAFARKSGDSDANDADRSAIGKTLQSLFFLDPFITINEKELPDGFAQAIKGITIKGKNVDLPVIEHEGSAPKIPATEFIYAGKFTCSPSSTFAELGYMSALYGITLDMTRATKAQKEFLTVIRGTIVDDSEKPLYPNLRYARGIQVRNSQTLRYVAPLVDKLIPPSVYRDRFIVGKTSTSHHLFRCIPRGNLRIRLRKNNKPSVYSNHVARLDTERRANCFCRLAVASNLS